MKTQNVEKIFETAKENRWNIPKTADDLGISLWQLQHIMPIEIKKIIYSNTLEYWGWDVKRAAEQLGIGKKSIYKIFDKDNVIKQKREFRKKKIIELLIMCDWNVEKTAKWSGIDEKIIYDYIGKEFIRNMSTKKQMKPARKIVVDAAKERGQILSSMLSFPHKRVYIPEFRKYINLGYRNSVVMRTIAKLKADVALGKLPKYAHKLFRYLQKENEFRERNKLPPIPKLPLKYFESVLEMRRKQLAQKTSLRPMHGKQKIKLLP